MVYSFFLFFNTIACRPRLEELGENNKQMKGKEKEKKAIIGELAEVGDGE